MFQHLLHEADIRIPLEASSREGALAELIATLPSFKFSAQQKSNLLEVLLQREFFESTAVGNQLALPQCVLPGIEAPFFLMGISRKGIMFPSQDGQPVHFVFLSVFPEKSGEAVRRYSLLHEIEIFFNDPFLRERLKICETPEEVCEIFVRESQTAFPPQQFRFRNS